MMARFVIVAALGAGLAAVCASAATAAELASGWSEGKTDTKARLVAGEAGGKAIAAVEIALGEGWKTYWRFPGDAGGVPPLFDWSKSANVKTVKVLYPAPQRLHGADGDSLGYKGGVIFPVVLEAVDASKPIALKLGFDYGICRDVCVPVTAELSLDVPASGLAAASPAVLSALDHVPHSPATRVPADPKLVRADVRLDGAHPMIGLEVEAPGAADSADAFVESPEGVYIPLPKPGAIKPLGKDLVRIEIDLTDAVDPKELRGKTANVTLVSAKGRSEASFKLD